MKDLSRRDFLRTVAGTAAGYGLAGATGPLWVAGGTRFSAENEALLDDIERTAALYFWEQANPYNGLTKDRSRADGPDERDVTSIATTGFGLATLCIADRRGYLKHDKIVERVLTTLRFFAKRLQHQHGWFYHWLTMQGERTWESEVSSIDTALLLCGILTCAEYFQHAEITDLAGQIYGRVDWPWMLNGGKTLAMGWKPEGGFLKARWDRYNELMMIYLLGLGSPTHPLPAETWEAWARPVFNFEGTRFIGAEAPLFVHQFSHAYFDFRLRRDKHADYFLNSVIATQVHRQFCVELGKRFPSYSEDLWGISASDSMHGYQAWGGPPPLGPIDGTVVPNAAAGSLPFLPAECLHTLSYMRKTFGSKIWKRYGFVDAFHPLKKWFDPDVIGIDLGISALMSENARTGFLWTTFMKNESAQRGMVRAGFANYTLEPPQPPRPPAKP